MNYFLKIEQGLLNRFNWLSYAIYKSLKCYFNDFLEYINRKKWHGCVILTKRSTSAFKGNFRIMIGNYDF